MEDKDLLNILKQAVKEAQTEAAAEAAASKRPTVDEIMSIKDTYQRQKAISENLDLFGGGNND